MAAKNDPTSSAPEPSTGAEAGSTESTSPTKKPANATDPAATAAPEPALAPSASATATTTATATTVQGLSIASMVSGLVGVLLSTVGFGLLPAIAGVILGHLAQRREPAGRPFWLTGLISGYVGLGISLIAGVVVLLAIIAFVTARTAFGF